MMEYRLNVTFSGSEKEKYSIEEILRDRAKRSHVLSVCSSIKELDEQSSIFTSFENMNEELNRIYEKNIKLYRPFIIFDKSDDLSESKAIYNIVYSEDYKEIENADNIKLWTIDYLKKNPSDIEEFYGLRTIYANKHKGEILTGDLIKQMVNSYFEGYDYSKVRNAYFTLKRLDGKEKKNEIHR